MAYLICAQLISGLHAINVAGFATASSLDMDRDEAQAYLESLLNKNLRIITTDGRLFLGSFKCTDAERNVVLANTYKYRHPSADTVHRHLHETPKGAVTVDMTSRYLGLVVVPGCHVVKMELEQFASQVSASYLP